MKYCYVASNISEEINPWNGKPRNKKRVWHLARATTKKPMPTRTYCGIGIGADWLRFSEKPFAYPCQLCMRKAGYAMYTPAAERWEQYQARNSQPVVKDLDL